MAWVSIHQQIRDHRKLRDLFRELKISRQEALGILVLIWTWALDNCDKEGKLLSANKFDIAHAAYWNGEPDKLCNALIKTGWVDLNGNEMHIHDWYDFNKPFYDYTDRKAKDRERKRLINSIGNSVEIPQENCKEFHVSPAPAPAPAPAHKQEPLKSKDIVRFSPPTHIEVKDYCKERNNSIDAEKWFDFYQSKGWMVGKNKMKDWKACVRTWEKETKKTDKNESEGFFMDKARRGE
jgi:hypothetical protein